MIGIMERVMPLCGLHDPEQWPNSCNLNQYESGAASVQWHSDDESLFENPSEGFSIISPSLGAKRSFEIKGKWRDAPVQSIALRDGDVFTMEGHTQKHYVHRVPKEIAQGVRLNLTWRWVTIHCAGCRAKPCKATPAVLPIS